MSVVARHVFVSGRVQGVAFRWETRRRADALGLAGWVRNLADGRVEVWVEGEPDDVETMATWLDGGPPAARVDDLVLLDVAPEGLDGFAIRRTAHG